jgi:hypothetical protein
MRRSEPGSRSCPKVFGCLSAAQSFFAVCRVVARCVREGVLSAFQLSKALMCDDNAGLLVNFFLKERALVVTTYCLIRESWVMQKPLPANESPRVADLCQQMEYFTSRLSHDLRGSLQLITGYADLLAAGANGSLDPDQLRWVNFIQAGAKGIRDTMDLGQARLKDLIQSEDKLK